MAIDLPQNTRNALANQTTPISARDSATGDVVPNVGDTINAAIRVNVVAGGGGGGGNVNLTGINGVAPSVGNGTTDAGTLRVTVSSDSTGQVKLAAGVAVIGSLAANQSVNVAQVAGTATSVNNGTTNAGTQRVTIASDSTGQVKLAAGANAIGTVGVTSVVPLTGSANLGKQFGGLVNAGDVGVFALAVDVGTGNYTYFAITNGALATTPTYGGSPASVNNGTTDATTQRVTISNDSTGQVKLAAGVAVIGSLAANQSVNVAQVAGTATSVNNGTVDAGTQRVTLASNSTGQVTLAAGAATIGALTANQSVNVAQINGVTATMGNGVSGTGVQRVTIASDSTGQVTLASGSLVTITPGTTGGWSKVKYAAQTTTVQTVKGSAGTLGGYYVYNPNSTVAYVQIFDNSGAITLGTTVPDIILGIPALSAANLELANGVNMANAIKLACTTTATGLTAPGTGLDLTVFYK
jgi:hypothetical protein